ncbi:Uncharacterised protein [Mycobacteroides abscessus]|nr:Uncharacterised protein [Mycobacteroides abscessus]
MSFASAPTTSRRPTRNATRQPAMENDFVIEYSSTATSRAPSHSMIDGGSNPSNVMSAYARSCTSTTSLSRAQSTRRWRSSLVATVVVGLCGNDSTTTRGLGQPSSHASMMRSMYPAASVPSPMGTWRASAPAK